MTRIIHFGTNLGFAKYVWGPEAVLDIARERLGLKAVELVTDNDFGPAFHLIDREAFVRHHGAVGHYARSKNMRISSVFTFYRDGGAVAHPDPAIRAAAQQALYSLADEAAAVGAPYACASFMTALRDDFDRDPRACQDRAFHAWAEWMTYARIAGLQGLLVEMSAQAREDFATIEQTRSTLKRLQDYHQAHPDTTAPVELCYDVGHGMALEESPDKSDRDFRAWFRAFPMSIREVHLKNTDIDFLATWPFTPAYEKTGIVQPQEIIAAVRDILEGEVYLMLEIAGKRGREAGERQILEDLTISVDVWKRALQAEGYRERADGAWEFCR
ncbi:MAG: sugar phosphate isomerase/epimerase [Armatimonadota bacterium]|nr:sugar phosphate isomerase/epimerase [Armatimonadota bacterium]